MTSLQASIGQDDFSAGMVRDVAPALIPQSGVYDLVNGLLDEEGSPYRRGGTTYLSEVDLEPSVLDAFNRPNESPIAGEWKGKFGLGTDLKLEAERLVPTVAGAEGSAIYNKVVTDGFVAIDIEELLGAYSLVEVLGRTAHESEEEAFEGYRLSADSLGNFAITRHHGFTTTLLASGTGPLLTAGDSLGLMLVGTSISGWVKHKGVWSQVIGATDATHSTGRIGIGAFEVKLDNLSFQETDAFSTSGLTWVWDGYLLPGQRTVFADDSNFGVLNASDQQLNVGGTGLTVPKQSASIEDLLFIGGTAIYGGSRKTAVYSTGKVKVTKGSKVVTGEGTAWLANVDVGMLFQRKAGDRIYVVEEVVSNAELKLRDAYEGGTEEKQTYELTPLYTIGLDPYEPWEFMTVCSNRLVVANGRTIKFTDFYEDRRPNPHTFKNIEGTANEHTVPEGVRIVGLSSIGGVVLIFTTAGIWVLDGLALDITDLNGNSQHRLEQISRDVVLAGAAGLAGSEQVILVPALDGIYLMDGISEPQRISRPIESLYRKRIDGGYRLGGGRVYRGHYFLPIINGEATVRELLVCRLDRPGRSRGGTVYPWARFTGDGGKVTCFAVRATTDPREPKLLGAQGSSPSRVLDCSGYFSPEHTNRLDADGSSQTFEITTRDYGTGAGTINSVRSVKPRYELVGNGRLQVAYSDGALATTGARFGQAKFGQAKFGGSKTAFNVIGEGGANDGRNPARLRVNKALRVIRLRLRSLGEPDALVIRSLEIKPRPSEAVRR